MSEGEESEGEESEGDESEGAEDLSGVPRARWPGEVARRVREEAAAAGDCKHPSMQARARRQPWKAGHPADLQTSCPTYISLC